MVRRLLCWSILLVGLLATATAAPRPMTRAEKTEIMHKRKRRAQEARRRRMSRRGASTEGAGPGAAGDGTGPPPAVHRDGSVIGGPESLDARDAIRDAKRDQFREQHVKFMARYDHDALRPNPDGTRRQPRKDYINPAYREEYEAGLGNTPDPRRGGGEPPPAEMPPPMDARREMQEMGRLSEQKYKKMQAHRNRHKRRMDVHRRRIAEVKRARERAMARRGPHKGKPPQPPPPQTRPAATPGEEL